MAFYRYANSKVAPSCQMKKNRMYTNVLKPASENDFSGITFDK